MRNRRIVAYGIDVILFVAISLLVLFLFRGITGNFLRFIANLLGLIVVYGVIFGLVSTYLRGSIGKKLMDLKVMPTVGMMTPIRLLLRDAVSKYIAFFPIVLGIMPYSNNLFGGRINEQPGGGLTVGVLVSLVLILALAGANGYMYIKEKKVLVDFLFHTNVENDIPTASEYQDLSAFLERENEA